MTLLLICLINVGLLCQSDGLRRGTDIFLDVLSYSEISLPKSLRKKDANRLDIYVAVPYQSLQFLKNDGVYGGNYKLTVIIRDTANANVHEESSEHFVRELSYANSRGAKGNVDVTQLVLALPSGIYKVEAIIKDKLSKNEFSRSRKITILPYADFPFALSSIMFASSIEAQNSQMTVTPYLSENIGLIRENGFLFFEIYNQIEELDSVDIRYQIANDKGKTIYTSPAKRFSTLNAVTQQYFKLSLPANMLSGTYTVKLFGVRTTIGDDFTQKEVLASSDRSMQFDRTLFDGVVMNIEKAIRQLRYVATQTALDYMEEGSTLDEKRNRFEEFWKPLDPIPATPTNEAFEEYFRRIDYVNRVFRSYNEGWLTDMGMIFIIYGEPTQRDRQNSLRSDGRNIERWLYSNRNLTFMFVDNSGFGDFRLLSPYPAGDKYRYQF